MGELHLRNELGKVQAQLCMSDEQFGGAEGEHMSDEHLVGGSWQNTTYRREQRVSWGVSHYKSSVSCCCLMS